MQELLIVLSWIGTITALLGSLCIARGKPYAGFPLLLLSLACSSPRQVETKTWAQVVMFAALAVIYAHGLYRAHRELMKPFHV